MARRFSDIRRAKELEPALAAYKEWLDESFDSSKRKLGGAVGSTRKRIFVYVKPFGNSAETAYRSSRSVASSTKLGTVNNRVSLEPTGNNNSYFVFQKGQKPCRVNLWQSNGARAYVQSKITKLFYLKYTDAETYSSPIGRLTENEKEPIGVAAAFVYLREQAGAADYVRVWHTPEDMIASRG